MQRYLFSCARHDVLRLLGDLQRHTNGQSGNIRRHAVSLTVADDAAIRDSIVARVHRERPVCGLAGGAIPPGCAVVIAALPLVAQAVALCRHMQRYLFSCARYDVLRLLGDLQGRANRQSGNIRRHAASMAVADDAAIRDSVVACIHRERPVCGLAGGAIPPGCAVVIAALPLVAQTVALCSHMQRYACTYSCHNARRHHKSSDPG